MQREHVPNDAFGASDARDVEIMSCGGRLGDETWILYEPDDSKVTNAWIQTHLIVNPGDWE